MGLKKSDYFKLLHDLRRIGDTVQIITDEPKQRKRKIIADLLRAEMDRLSLDIEEMRDKPKEKND